MQSDARTILPDELWMFLQALPPILHLAEIFCPDSWKPINMDLLRSSWSCMICIWSLLWPVLSQCSAKIRVSTRSDSLLLLLQFLHYSLPPAQQNMCTFLWPYCALYCTILNSENLKPQRIWAKLRQASFGNRQSSSPSRSQRLWSTNLCGVMPAGATGARGLALCNRLVLQSLRIQRNQDSDSDFEIAGISNSSKPIYSASSSGLFWILCISCWISALTSAKGGLMARTTSRQNATKLFGKHRWPFCFRTQFTQKKNALQRDASSMSKLLSLTTASDLLVWRWFGSENTPQVPLLRPFCPQLPLASQCVSWH